MRSTMQRNKIRTGCIAIGLLALGALSLLAMADTISTPIMKYGYGPLLCTAMLPDGTQLPGPGMARRGSGILAPARSFAASPDT